MTLPDFATAIADVTAALDALRIRYLVGGSVASLVHGEPRNTQDVDLVVDLRRAHIEPLVKSLAATFVADPVALHWAVDHHASCNLVHRATGYKVDLFLLRPRPFSRNELERAMILQVATGLAVRVAAAEDCG